MTLEIAIVSDAQSWMRGHIAEMVDVWVAAGHRVRVSDTPDYDKVDVSFFLSFSKIVSAEILSKAKSNVVVHGSALPSGKGWSPWSWQILEGKSRLTLTLFEAVEGVDSGPIYDQRHVELEGHELIEEWQNLQAHATVAMCRDFIQKFPSVLESGRAQTGSESFYEKRKPENSRLDPELSLAEQFNLLRIVDNKRYPAFFDVHGHTYELQITKRRSGWT